MSRRTPHRRRAVLGSLVLVGVLVIAGCSEPSNTPTEFDEQTQTNWLDSCTANWEGSGTTLASSNTCECTYTVVTGRYQDDFNAFVELNNKLRSDPNAMPQDLIDEFATCPGWAGGGGEQQATTTQVGPVAPQGTAGTQAP